jgi:hypothetical protein
MSSKSGEDQIQKAIASGAAIFGKRLQCILEPELQLSAEIVLVACVGWKPSNDATGGNERLIDSVVQPNERVFVLLLSLSPAG